MKKLLLSSAVLATFALFTACGDDVTEVTEVNEIHQDGVAVLDAGLELSKQKCDSTNVGDMLFVTDSSEVFVCNGKTWQTLKGADGEPGKPGADGNDGDDGENGESCTAKSVKDSAGLAGLEVTCGKTVVGTIWNGEKGEDGDDGDNGTSCTAEPVKNAAGVEGLEVTCGKTVVGTIWNGEKGEPGEDGNDGNDGDDGKNCEVSREGNVLTITCANSTETINLDDIIQSSSNDEESSSSEEESSSSVAEESSSSNVIASSSGAKQSSSSEEDSSSSEESSSSANGSSSSVADAVCYGEYGAEYTCVTTRYLNQDMLDTNGYGEFVDTDDKKVYKTVEICNEVKSSCQIWMAQNLNNEIAESYCYDDNSGNCDTYGRLYSWTAALDACPSGWHLPSLAEWQRLLEPMATSMDDYSSYWYYYGAGRMLKSKDGWNYNSESTEGIDYYGFSALPAGGRNYDGDFNSAGDYAYFWSSSEHFSPYAYAMHLYYDREPAYLGDYNKGLALSVRCIKD